MSKQTENAIWSSWIRPLAKLSLAGASLVAIAAAIVIFGTEGDVSDSEALVWDPGQFEQTNTQKFAQSLEHLGHSPPRTYDYNGNEVFFSTRTSKKSPERLLREYQRAFVNRGLNDKIYEDSLVAAEGATDKKSIRELSRKSRNQQLDKTDLPGKETRDEYAGLLTGEVVPRKKSAERISMVGVLTRNNPDTIEEAMNERREFVEEYSEQGTLNYAVKLLRKCGYSGPLEKSPKTDGGQFPHKLEKRLNLKYTAMKHSDILDDCPAWQQFARQENALLKQSQRRELFKGFRSVEIYRPAGAESTSITAVWSDDTFELNKAINSPKRGQKRASDGDSPSIPACSSCVHQTHFASRKAGSAYETNMFSSTEGPDQVLHKYTRKLRSEGWKSTGAGILLNEVLKQSRGADQYRGLVMQKNGRRMVVGAFPSAQNPGRTRIATMLEGR